MSRTRMFGTLAAVVACAGFVAGCGGGGYTAAESAPTSTTPAAAAAAAGAPAGPTAQGVIGSFAQSDPASSNDQTFSSFTRFPQTRAGKIFVGPAAPAATAPAVAAAPVVTPAANNPVTTIPTSPSAPPPTTTTTTPAPVAIQRSASLDVSGAVETVTVGGQTPAAAPQFTVVTITSTGVTLKLNSGTLPGGGTTVELLKGVPVTLSNPSTGTNLTINVLEIKTQV